MPLKPIAVILLLCGLLASFRTLPAQEPVAPPPDQTLTADQLQNLVAPIALYPDPLLGQILAASTYPLEVVEAWQWLQKNPDLTGAVLTSAVQQENWDPSVQALVVFPDVLKQLNADVNWTTTLGNAFLAQQQDVMDAVQALRQKAEQAGKLASTPQEQVADDQGMIDINPVDPNAISVPEYNPVWIWGPAMYYPYPGWDWPPYPVVVGGAGFGFYPPISMGFYFGYGWNGWGGWGWHPAWGTHTLIVNNAFVRRYNFNEARGVNQRGTTSWAHDPGHRMGVPYANAALRTQYRASVRSNLAAPAERMPVQPRNSGEPTERMGDRAVPQNAPAANRSAFSGYENGSAAQQHSDHGYSSLGPARSSQPAPRPAPQRPAERPSAPASDKRR
ncbi:MAG: DUF3300 domain-containing protein [Bryobacteraceae bacterium]|jgi:hypothetical protein